MAGQHVQPIQTNTRWQIPNSRAYSFQHCSHSFKFQFLILNSTIQEDRHRDGNFWEKKGYFSISSIPIRHWHQPWWQCSFHCFRNMGGGEEGWSEIHLQAAGHWPERCKLKNPFSWPVLSLLYFTFSIHRWRKAGVFRSTCTCTCVFLIHAC